MKKLKTSIWFIAIAYALTATSCFAVDLVDVYKQALKSDPKYQSARQKYLAATEQFPQARSFLLPNVALNGQYFYEDFKSTSNFISSTLLTGQNYFKQLNYTLQLTQPLLSFSNWYQMDVARARVRAAAAEYAAAWQDLMLRTSTAYFNVLQAEDVLRFTGAQLRTTKREYEQAKERFNVGLDAITSVYNAEASYDNIIARMIAAKNNVKNTREQLQAITGVYYQNLATLKPNFKLLTPQPNNVDLWVNTAVKQNLALKASDFTVEAQKQNIRVQFGGAMPVVNGYGQYNLNRQSNDGLGTAGNTDISQVGVQLNLPIYQGGLVVANTKQAKYQYQQSLADRETTYRQTVTDTIQTFNNIMDGISKVSADRQSIISNQSSVDSTEAALLAGTRTIVDLLNAQQLLFNAQTTLAQDQYAYLINTLTLKQLAGTLNVGDINSINRWLDNSHLTSSEDDNDYDSSMKSSRVKSAQHTNYANQVSTDLSDKTKETPSSSKTSPVTTQKKSVESSKAKSDTQTTTQKSSSDFYTIQLLGTHDKSSLDKFIQEHKLHSEAFIEIGKGKNGADWYSLYFGHYTTEHEALDAIKKLPQDLQKLNPWVRHHQKNT